MPYLKSPCEIVRDEVVATARQIVLDHPGEFDIPDCANAPTDEERDAEFQAWEDASVPESICTIEFYVDQPE